MGRAIVAGGKVGMEAPSGGILASSLAVGNTVKIKENGNLVEFYVLKHDYESTLNGSGRTLLLRKDCLSEREWDSNDVNAYANSDVDSWLNGEYMALLDADVQEAIGTTKFYYTPGNRVNTVTTLERSIFMLSVTEFGLSASYANTEGSAIPSSANYKVAYHDGSAVWQWTRTPVANDRGNPVFAYRLDKSGAVSYNYCGNVQEGEIICPRPCFTLPAAAVFDAETLEFKGVA